MVQVVRPNEANRESLREEFAPLFKTFCLPRTPAKVLKTTRLWLVWGLILRLCETPVPEGKGNCKAHDPDLDKLLTRIDPEFDLCLADDASVCSDTSATEGHEVNNLTNLAINGKTSSDRISTPLSRMQATTERKPDRSQPRFKIHKKMRAGVKKHVRTPKSRSHLQGLGIRVSRAKHYKDMSLLIRNTVYPLPEDSSDKLEIIKKVFATCRKELIYDDDDSHTEGEEE